MTTSHKRQNACVHFAFGCYRSMMSSERIVAYLKINGYNVTKSLYKADIIFASVCAVTQTTEDASFKFLSQVERKKRKDARLIIIGCLTSITYERVSQYFPKAL